MRPATGRPHKTSSENLQWPMAIPKAPPSTHTASQHHAGTVVGITIDNYAGFSNIPELCSGNRPFPLNENKFIYILSLQRALMM